jgi:hypothetical protein
MSRVEARTVEYFAVEVKTGREMRVPHITPELAEKWTGEGLFIVTRETRALVPIFGALQTVLPEPQEPRGSNDKPTLESMGIEPGQASPL